MILEVLSITAMENTVLRDKIKVPRPDRFTPDRHLPAMVEGPPDPEWSAAAEEAMARLPIKRMGS